MFIKHNIPIVYVDVENSTRWTIAYVDVTNAPYKLHLTTDRDTVEFLDLSNFKVFKRLLDSSQIYDETSLQWVSFKTFIDSFIIEDITVFDFESIKTDDFVPVEELSFQYETKKFDEFLLVENAILIWQAYRSFENVLEIFDQTSLGINPQKTEQFNTTDYTPAKSSGMVISDLTFQDYFIEDYFDWQTVGQNWETIYNNTFGIRDRTNISDTVVVSLNP